MHVIIVILLSEAGPLSVTLPAPGCSSGKNVALPAPAARGNRLNDGELISTRTQRITVRILCGEELQLQRLLDVFLSLKCDEISANYSISYYLNLLGKPPHTSPKSQTFKMMLSGKNWCICPQKQQ